MARRLPAIQPGLGPRTPLIGTELGAQDLFKGRHFEKVIDFEIFFNVETVRLDHLRSHPRGGQRRPGQVQHPCFSGLKIR